MTSLNRRYILQTPALSRIGFQMTSRIWSGIISAPSWSRKIYCPFSFISRWTLRASMTGEQGDIEITLWANCLGSAFLTIDPCPWSLWLLPELLSTVEQALSAYNIRLPSFWFLSLLHLACILQNCKRMEAEAPWKPLVTKWTTCSFISIFNDYHCWPDVLDEYVSYFLYDLQQFLYPEVFSKQLETVQVFLVVLTFCYLLLTI